jgi:hypothetical protein
MITSKKIIFIFPVLLIGLALVLTVRAGTFDQYYCSPSGVALCYCDLDEDGYFSTSPTYCQPGCQTVLGNDCNDSRDDINPGQSEICDDLIDNDCDGANNCSDADCSSNPACLSSEICNNGIDDDGNGFIDCQDFSCAGQVNDSGAICCWSGGAKVDSYCTPCHRCGLSGPTVYHCEIQPDAADGNLCVNDCTSCVSGSCNPRSAGSDIECGQACLACDGSALDCQPINSGTDTQGNFQCLSPQSCASGSCQSPGDFCTDTDSGADDFTTLGMVSGNGGGFYVHQDSCSGNVLTEWGCSGTNPVSQNFSCTSLGSGWSCLGGLCVPPGDFCSQSDGGNVDYQNYGTVTGYNSGLAFNNADSCSGNVLTEWGCSGTSSISSEYNCIGLGTGWSCAGGECVPPTSGSYYCDSDEDSWVSSSVSGNCSPYSSCIPVACQATAGPDCDDGRDQIYPGALETSCNLIDNDCDGDIDEDYAQDTIVSTCGVGACQTTGYLNCTASGVVDTCVPLPASSEICGDGIDNNCNGTIDDGCLDECNFAAGETTTCSNPEFGFRGVCAAASLTVTCNANGSWNTSSCEAARQGSEVGFCSDNLDNDCDGLTDCQETVNCPANNVCQGNCLLPATCNQTTFDWQCSGSSSLCGSGANACGVCQDQNPDPNIYNFVCSANQSACSSFACGTCLGSGTSFSCQPDHNKCTDVCSECSSTMVCVDVLGGADSNGLEANQCDADSAPAGSVCGTAGGPPCQCSDLGVCITCTDADSDGICDDVDPCPYDPDNDFDNDSICALGCSSGVSCYTGAGVNCLKQNGYICNNPVTNLVYDTCQGGSTVGGAIPDDCKAGTGSCKVVFGALDYFNIYVNGKLLTGNLNLPKYNTGNLPGRVIDYVYFNFNDYFVAGNNVIAFEGYDQGYPTRQIRGAFADVNDPVCGTAGCALCSEFAGLASRTDPVSGSSAVPDMPVKCYSINNFPEAAPPIGWNELGFNDSAWSNSAFGSYGTAGEIENRLWLNNSAMTRYNSPMPIWSDAGSYGTGQSRIYCRYTFTK